MTRPALLAALLALPALAPAQDPKPDPAKKDPPAGDTKTLTAPPGWVFFTNKDGLTVYLLPKDRAGSSNSEKSFRRDGFTGKQVVTSFELADGRELTVVVTRLGGPALKELKVGDVYDMAYDADKEPGAKLSEPQPVKMADGRPGKEHYVTKKGEAMRVVVVVTKEPRLVQLVVTAPTKAATQDETADRFLHSLILRPLPKKDPAKADPGKGEPKKADPPAPKDPPAGT